MDEIQAELRFVGSSYKDYTGFPEEVQDDIGYALYLAQVGDKASSAKPLSGFAGASVLEIVESFDGDAYRAVYTVRFAGVVFVLHAFQKKSKSGISTPKHEIALVKQRLMMAEEDYKTWKSKRK
jgi:phage-related protein